MDKVKIVVEIGGGCLREVRTNGRSGLVEVVLVDHDNREEADAESLDLLDENDNPEGYDDCLNVVW